MLLISAAEARDPIPITHRRSRGVSYPRPSGPWTGCRRTRGEAAFVRPMPSSTATGTGAFVALRVRTPSSSFREGVLGPRSVAHPPTSEVAYIELQLEAKDESGATVATDKTVSYYLDRDATDGWDFRPLEDYSLPYRSVCSPSVCRKEKRRTDHESSGESARSYGQRGSCRNPIDSWREAKTRPGDTSFMN